MNSVRIAAMLVAMIIMGGAGTYEVGNPVVDALEARRIPESYRPDLTGTRCMITMLETVDFTDPAAAEAEGLRAAHGKSVLAIPCGALATLLNNAQACTLKTDRPSGWPPRTIGNAPDCADPPPPPPVP